MNSSTLLRIMLCVATCGGFLYAYLSKQNTITKLRLEIPQAGKELAEIEQENTRLEFEIDRFESPDHLMELANKPEWRHLKHPLLSEIVEIPLPAEENR